MASVDAVELESKVKNMYRQVTEQPRGDYHFELGRPLAERLGYPIGSSRPGAGRGDRVLRRRRLLLRSRGPAGGAGAAQRVRVHQEQARGASAKYGVRSVSVLAVKPAR
jgi:hypothetical protein